VIELMGCDSTFHESLQLKIDIDEQEYSCDVTVCFATSRSSKITRKRAKRSAPNPGVEPGPSRTFLPMKARDPNRWTNSDND